MGSSSCNGAAGVTSTQQYAPCKTIERSYFKACRPYTVDSEAPEWRINLKSDRFIALNGIVLHSRLTPSASLMAPLNFPSEYGETLRMEISTTAAAATAPAAPGSDGEDEDHEHEPESSQQVIWRHSIIKQPTKYNCNLNVCWEKGVILSPDVDYQLRLCWPAEAYGAEYPCSLQSNVVEGIEFRDLGGTQFGSLLKGVRYTNLM